MTEAAPPCLRDPCLRKVPSHVCTEYGVQCLQCLSTCLPPYLPTSLPAYLPILHVQSDEKQRPGLEGVGSGLVVQHLRYVRCRTCMDGAARSTLPPCVFRDASQALQATTSLVVQSWCALCRPCWRFVYAVSCWLLYLGEGVCCSYLRYQGTVASVTVWL